MFFRDTPAYCRGIPLRTNDVSGRKRVVVLVDHVLHGGKFRLVRRFVGEEGNRLHVVEFTGGIFTAQTEGVARVRGKTYVDKLQFIVDVQISVVVRDDDLPFEGERFARRVSVGVFRGRRVDVRSTAGIADFKIARLSRFYIVAPNQKPIGKINKAEFDVRIIIDVGDVELARKHEVARECFRSVCDRGEGIVDAHIFRAGNVGDRHVDLRVFDDDVRFGKGVGEYRVVFEFRMGLIFEHIGRQFGRGIHIRDPIALVTPFGYFGVHAFGITDLRIVVSADGNAEVIDARIRVLGVHQREQPLNVPHRFVNAFFVVVDVVGAQMHHDILGHDVAEEIVLQQELLPVERGRGADAEAERVFPRIRYVEIRPKITRVEEGVADEGGGNAVVRFALPCRGKLRFIGVVLGSIVVRTRHADRGEAVYGKTRLIGTQGRLYGGGALFQRGNGAAIRIERDKAFVVFVVDLRARVIRVGVDGNEVGREIVDPSVYVVDDEFAVIGRRCGNGKSRAVMFGRCGNLHGFIGDEGVHRIVFDADVASVESIGDLQRISFREHGFELRAFAHGYAHICDGERAVIGRSIAAAVVCASRRREDERKRDCRRQSGGKNPFHSCFLLNFDFWRTGKTHRGRPQSARPCAQPAPYFIKKIFWDFFYCITPQR